jgi:hypothetical protein
MARWGDADVAEGGDCGGAAAGAESGGGEGEIEVGDNKRILA